MELGLVIVLLLFILFVAGSLLVLAFLPFLGLEMIHQLRKHEHDLTDSN
jgi:hypothetical protein